MVKVLVKMEMTRSGIFTFGMKFGSVGRVAKRNWTVNINTDGMLSMPRHKN